jgi:hypothetical protein
MLYALCSMPLGINVALIIQPRDKYSASLGRVEHVDPLLAQAELV